jgi:hypothetical protein
MLPEPIGTDACLLARRWVLAPHLAEMLVALDQWAREETSRQGVRWPGIRIISGHRSKRRQTVINPNAPDSLHTRCPSLAADLSVGYSSQLRAVPAGGIWDWLGARWMMMGGRWGGMFQDATGMQKRDENHFDLGPA